MVVITNTSPLNYLVLTDHAQLLPLLYGAIIAPEAVLAELSHPAAPGAVRAFAANPPVWLLVRHVRRVDSTLAPLGAGEREAISLAVELPADVLLIDERAGRRAALNRWVTVAGTIAVLEKAAIQGLVDLAPAIASVRLAGLRVSQDIVDDVLRRGSKV